MPAVGSLDLEALGRSICKGVTDGNQTLVAGLMARSDSNHDLRNLAQTAVDKSYALDTEVKLLKSIIVSLNGNGDGNSGSVPRLEVQVTGLRSDMTGLKGDVGQLRGDVGSIRSDIAAMRETQAQQKSWTDGWKGVSVALGILGTCLTVMGAIITLMFWVFSHGGFK